MLIIHHQEPTPRIRERKKTRIDMIEERGQTTNESFLKRVVLCTISISIFAFNVCRTSWHADSLFPHSFNIYFSTVLFSAFARTFERKFMFLVCNGILAILAKSSSNRTGSSSSPSRVPEFDVLASVSVEGEATVDGNVVPRNSTALAYVEDEELEQQEEKETDLLRIWTSRAGMKEDEEDINMVEGGEEGGGGGGGGEEESVSNLDAAEETSAAITEAVSTEELNRTIEEFIREIKEEIWIVAQSQLIAVQ